MIDRLGGPFSWKRSDQAVELDHLDLLDVEAPEHGLDVAPVLGVGVPAPALHLGFRAGVHLRRVRQGVLPAAKEQLLAPLFFFLEGFRPSPKASFALARVAVDCEIVHPRGLLTVCGALRDRPPGSDGHRRVFPPRFRGLRSFDSCPRGAVFWCCGVSVYQVSRLTITLDHDLHRALKETEARQGRSIASIIEESLRLRGIKAQASARELVDEARRRARLEPDEALEVAVEETNAVRRR